MIFPRWQHNRRTGFDLAEVFDRLDGSKITEHYSPELVMEQIIPLLSLVEIHPDDPAYASVRSFLQKLGQHLHATTMQSG